MNCIFNKNRILNIPDKIQAVLVGYRKYVNPTKNDLKYTAEFTVSEILTRT